MSTGIHGIEDLEKHVAYYSGYVLTGANFAKRDDGWLLILKVKGRRGSNLVTFIHDSTPSGCLDVVHLALTTTHFTLKWREDKFIKG